MTDRELMKKEIIEEILTLMPEVIGNLMSQTASLNKVKKKMFEENPDFVGHNAVIASVLEMEEGKDITKDYESILKAAVPKIRERIKTTSGLTLDSIKEKKDLDLNISDDTNGAL